MKKISQTKKVDDFQNDFIKRPDCVIGGNAGVVGDGDIDRDKAQIPTQGH